MSDFAEIADWCPGCNRPHEDCFCETPLIPDYGLNMAAVIILALICLGLELICLHELGRWMFS